jgi:alpha-tubulin suppressor-like RCC1 family protein
MVCLTGCYAPTLPEDQGCSETDRCPEGLSCDLATHTCVSELPEAARFVQLSAYFHHTCGIDATGALWCWGESTRGALGVIDDDPRFVPELLAGAPDWKQVSVGKDISCGIRDPDTLWCWGQDLADLGSDERVPVQVPGNWSAVAAGEDGYCSIGLDGSVSCRFRPSSAPVVQNVPIVATQIGVARGAVCAIDNLQQLFCWGDNASGQLGTGDQFSLPAETPNHIEGTWQSLSLGDEHVCAIDTAGGMSCWGSCGAGQLGRDDDCFTPERVDDKIYTAVDAGDGHTCAVRNDGVMVCFGDNRVGQLGERGGVATVELTPIARFDQWTAVAAGDEYTCGLRGDGEAWCWGTNRRGELGDGGGGLALDPVPIDGLWDAVTVGFHTVCGIQTDRSLWCFGGNAFGQLGDGTVFERRRPVRIGSDQDWLAVSPGRTVTCGIRAPGTLWCWGDNDNRQLGTGSTSSSLVPVQVGTDTTWTEVAVTNTNVCGVSNGELFCWGRDVKATPERQDRQVTSLHAHPDSGFTAIDGGRLFAWTQTPSAAPDEVFVTDWTYVENGLDHTCGLRGDQIWCVGQNSNGQLGNAGEATTFAVQEQTLGSWSAVDSGGVASCAIATDGHLACWGNSRLLAAGREVDNANVAMTVGSALWRSVSVGADDACGIQSDDTLHCWGVGDASARGDGRGGHELPTRVSPP